MIFFFFSQSKYLFPYAGKRKAGKWLNTGLPCTQGNPECAIHQGKNTEASLYESPETQSTREKGLIFSSE